MPRTNAILFAVTNHGQLGDTGESTGYYVPEAAHAWKVFRSAGYRVDFVSPAGGAVPRTGADTSDPAQREFLGDPAVTAALQATARPADLDPAGYDAIFYVGGHGTMWDFPDNQELARVAATIYEADGVVSAVCHGPAGLLGITLSDGHELVAGRKLAAFTNTEEVAAGQDGVVPFLLQTALADRGAKHTGAPDFERHVVVDERLITGQNPASATGVAEAVVTALAA